jgi:hypothetical protein
MNAEARNSFTCCKFFRHGSVTLHSFYKKAQKTSGPAREKRLARGQQSDRPQALDQLNLPLIPIFHFFFLWGGLWLALRRTSACGAPHRARVVWIKLIPSPTSGPNSPGAPSHTPPPPLSCSLVYVQLMHYQPAIRRDACVQSLCV